MLCAVKRDPHDAALFYAALGKTTLLQGARVLLYESRRYFLCQLDARCCRSLLHIRLQRILTKQSLCLRLALKHPVSGRVDLPSTSYESMQQACSCGVMAT